MRNADGVTERAVVQNARENQKSFYAKDVVVLACVRPAAAKVTNSQQFYAVTLIVELRARIIHECEVATEDDVKPEF